MHRLHLSLYIDPEKPKLLSKHILFCAPHRTIETHPKQERSNCGIALWLTLRDIILCSAIVTTDNGMKTNILGQG